MLLGNWQRSTSWWAVSQPTILPFSQPQQRSWRPLIPALFSLALSRAGATQSFLAECFLINTKRADSASSFPLQTIINQCWGGLWWRRVCNKPLRWEWTGGCMNWDLAEGICVYVRYMVTRSWKQRDEFPCGGSQDLVSLVPILNAEDSFCFSGGGALDVFLFGCLVCFLLFCFVIFFPSFFPFSDIWQSTSSPDFILSSGVPQVVYWHFL